MSGSQQIRLKKSDSRLLPNRNDDSSHFSNASRHSRRVRFLKLFLPTAAVILAGTFSWFTFFATPSGKMVISLNNTAESQDNKLVMTAPKVEGYTSANRPYSIKAEKAIQDPNKSGIIELRNISGSVPLSNRGNAQIKAASAFFDNVNGRLYFDKPFTIITADGVSARLLSADINIQSGQMNTDNNVEIMSATQHLTATSMHVSDNGRIIHFGGRVHLIVDKQGLDKVPANNKKPS